MYLAHCIADIQWNVHDKVNKYHFEKFGRKGLILNMRLDEEGNYVIGTPSHSLELGQFSHESSLGSPSNALSKMKGDSLILCVLTLSDDTPSIQ